MGAEEEDQAQEGVHDEESGALWLIAVCSETGSLLGLPLKSKNQMNLITHELLAFTQVLGHEAVQYYCDNEPTARQIVRLLVSSRTAMGLKTTMRATKLYDSAGNSLAENAVHRVRGLAASMMESLAEKIGLRFHHQHPLWSWACRHAAWTLNRYQVLRGTTSFELTHGKAYEGKVCPLGEVVFAYSKQKQGFKADPRWKVGICLGKTEVQDAWVIGDGNRVFLSKSLRRVADASTRYLACYQAFTAYSWEFQQNFGGRIVPSKRVAAMVGGPLLGLPTAETKGIAVDDDDAREIIAFSKSYAGKLEEVKDLVEVENKQPSEKEGQTEEQKLAEEKKQDYAEEKVSVPEIRTRDANSIDEENNQAGPSAPVTTPRSLAQKMNLEAEGSAGDPKRLKLTPTKPIHESEGELSEPKRLKTSGGGPQVERRVEATAVGQDTYYHMDQFFGEEEILACGEGDGEEDSKVAIPAELWSSASLERVPPDPPFWIDELADAVEEQRLLSMGVLEAMEEEKVGFKRLTTRFVRDWRVKPRPDLPGSPKQFLRRSRLVAREYAVDRRDDVHSPATGGQTLRLLPIIYLTKKLEEKSGGEPYWLGSMDVKDAFLQVPQEEPTQVKTARGYYEVKRNLPGQRLGAKAWFDYFTDWLKERGFSFSDINPCLGRKGEQMMVLIHVDDVMYVSAKHYMENTFLPDIRKRFDISEQHLSDNGTTFYEGPTSK